MAQFPTQPVLSRGESPSLFDRVLEDNTVKSDTEGGYEFRRPRFTRARRITFTTGFIALPHADYQTIMAFEAAHTRSLPFTYFDYLHGTFHQVRFDEVKTKYVGVGRNRMWDITIKMTEV
ncbi:hypothetical protein SAMN03159338_1596 [Sphingomonas sp. NFR04]|jgi:hypothetical protein|uniref:hypothetical protein n=1 Tax=Sphingomonas sp. NFR04 TaxID=1566283 RepID=UPI0008F06106|nr:hypothetical protein [Sphingomonas sp. NFR04]SFJ50525.1 hypothetical protein SAMN03159338_1596 [Sphingomonas sp. NFR04]